MAKTLMDFVGEARARVKHVSSDQLVDMMDDSKDLLIVDVREESEYAAGHIPGALLVPRGTLEGAADKNYPKRDPILCDARDRRLVLYCASGGRSAMAADTLNQMGFGEVYNLAGGWDNWVADDNPVEK